MCLPLWDSPTIPFPSIAEGFGGVFSGLEKLNYSPGHHPAEKRLKEDSNDRGIRLLPSRVWAPLSQRRLFITRPYAAVSSDCSQREKQAETDERCDERGMRDKTHPEIAGIWMKDETRADQRDGGVSGPR